MSVPQCVSVSRSSKFVDILVNFNKKKICKIKTACAFFCPKFSYQVLFSVQSSHIYIYYNHSSIPNKNWWEVISCIFNLKDKKAATSNHVNWYFLRCVGHTVCPTSYNCVLQFNKLNVRDYRQHAFYVRIGFYKIKVSIFFLKVVTKCSKKNWYSQLMLTFFFF